MFTHILVPDTPALSNPLFRGWWKRTTLDDLYLPTLEDLTAPYRHMFSSPSALSNNAPFSSTSSCAHRMKKPCNCASLLFPHPLEFSHIMYLQPCHHCLSPSRIAKVTHSTTICSRNCIFSFSDSLPEPTNQSRPPSSKLYTRIMLRIYIYRTQ
jgi:hypothetical protein